MRLIICFLIFVILSCNSENPEYPKEINTRYLRSQFDVAKWEIYFSHLNSRCQFYSDFNIKDSPLLETLDLKLIGLEKHHDTTCFNFTFYYDSIKLDAGSLYNYMILCTGIAFKGSNPKIIYMFNGSTVRSDRKFEPNSDEVLKRIKYIRKSYPHFNTWFRKEIEKRNIVNQSK